ncbi:MAG TPA: class A beta-lactamase, subclass A2 [Chryseosolibacter sp.]|nr:class A beta-lactamase, subclass A2 [Chryseosolibacter sp.]
MIKMIRLVFTLTLALSTSYSFAQTDGLLEQLRAITDSAKGKVGVAILNLSTGDSLTLNNKHHYPMQSVYKFPLGLAVLHEVDEGRLGLNDNINIRKSDLLPNTWSPLAEKYPGGNVSVKLHEVLHYTVSLSDNNGCDILFRLLGGPKRVQSYVTSLGIDDIAIVNTEEEMHEAWEVQFDNWASPYAFAQLLNAFHKKDILSESNHKLLWRFMTETPTGKNRIRGQLPEGTIVAHKTGTSGDQNGIVAAVNDAGIIQLPNGDEIALVVFVSQFAGSTEDAESLIAQIAKLVFDHYAAT